MKIPLLPKAFTLLNPTTSVRSNFTGFTLGNNRTSGTRQVLGVSRRQVGSLPKAFTLLEILIVLAIISVLIVLSMSMMNFINSQDSKNQAVLRKMDTLEQQLKMYRLKNGAYPSDISTNSNS